MIDNSEMVIQAPKDLIESMAEWQLPPRVDARLQELMDRNTEGHLSNEEKKDFKDLVALSESVSLLRARALHTLGKSP